MSLTAAVKDLCPPLVWRGLKRVTGRRSDPYDNLRPEHFLDGWATIEAALAAERARAGSRTPRFLDVGGRAGEKRGLAVGYEYWLLDLAPAAGGPRTLRADICHCPEIADAQYDVLFSVSLLEHVREPWEAARTVGRLLVPGGLAITRTLFAWEYHAKPVDFWRYTHSALEYLFERYGGLTTVRSGYDVGRRWRNRGTDRFQEHWEVIHIGRKPA